MRGAADMWADHVAGHRAYMELERNMQYLASNDPCDEFDHERIRPQMPIGEADVWYRGWEVGWDQQREFYSGEGYVAYKGGCDLDAPQLTSGSWVGILDAIDDEENE